MRFVIDWISQNKWVYVVFLFYLHIYAHLVEHTLDEIAENEEKAERCRKDEYWDNQPGSGCASAKKAVDKWPYLGNLGRLITHCWLEDVFSSLFSTTFLTVVVYLVLCYFFPSFRRFTTRIFAMAHIIDRPTAARTNVVVDFDSLMRAATAKKEPNYMQ